jgi:hypothetical protein
VWLYDACSKKSVNKSSEIIAKSADDAKRLRETIGLRAAGNFNGVVLLGGPALNDSLNLFAFDARSHKFIGSVNLPEYGNIRTFLVAEKALYLGVGIGTNGSSGGGVLRWTGSLQDPFSFEVVGSLPVQAADLTYYDGRLAITSWPASKATSATQLAGVWLSPKLADGEPGLNPEDATGWTQSWNAGQYEPDRIMSATYGGGGIAAYDGYLYWGTMHVPLKATKVHQAAYPQETEEAQRAQIRSTQRAASIWRGKDLGTPNQRIELLYGESSLPAYDPASSMWAAVPTSWTALYGKSGFGNTFNNYTWRMAVAGDRLFVGTMDWSYLLHNISDQPDPTDPAGWGSDLWMFPSAAQPAELISKNGLGNYLNYGVRNMVADGDNLFLGMANPMNLRTNPTDTVPEGGWELIKLTRSPT